MSRKQIIQTIEQMRDSQVITYVCGDRNGLDTQIGEDAVRVIYEHVLNKPANVRKLDLFIYSRGGDTSVPWRIVSMLREHYEEICALVPYKAHSAATMICLGADKIIMGKKAELGPIDPTLTRNLSAQAGEPPRSISVEDVNSYVNFIKEKAGLTDQNAVSVMIQKLAESITPLALGSVARTHSHIRLLAQKLLTSGSKTYPESKLEAIIETLCEKMYSHGHAIGRKEAAEMGLAVVKAEDVSQNGTTLDTLIWNLYLEYENSMKLLSPIDLEGEFANAGNQDTVTQNDLMVAAIESFTDSFTVTQNLILNKIRKVPSNLNLNVTLNLNVPQGLALPQQSQQILNALAQQAVQQAQQQVNAQIQAMAPVVGINGKRVGQSWVKSTNW